jgi:hypothetical protein
MTNSARVGVSAIHRLGVFAACACAAEQAVHVLGDGLAAQQAEKVRAQGER